MRQRKDQPVWDNIRIRRGLANEIDKFIDTKRAHELALLNRAAVVEYAVREFLLNKNEPAHLNKDNHTLKERIKQLEGRLLSQEELQEVRRLLSKS